MGDKKFSRRGFFGAALGSESSETAVDAARQSADDPLFQKCARKQLSGGRTYSEEIIEGDQHARSTARVTSVTSGLSAYTGTWSEWEAAHLLRRVGFGATNSEVSALAAMTVGNAVDSLFPSSSASFTPTVPSSFPRNFYAYYNSAGGADLGTCPYGGNWMNYPLPYSPYGTSYTSASTNGAQLRSEDAWRTQSTRAWYWGVWLSNPTSLVEKMVLFWYHFIPVDFDDLTGSYWNGAWLPADYMATIRQYAFGDFKTLIRKLVLSPAMMSYLNGNQNTGTNPNENLARELMELFVMGKDPQNYTESDVQEAARVLSGWNAPFASTSGSTTLHVFPMTTSFTSSRHTNRTGTANWSTFSSAFNGTVIPTSTSRVGSLELDDFLDMLFNNQGTTIARYICKRLYRFFVYYDIDAATETNVINGLATTLVNNNWNLVPVLKQLFKSQHFYDMANRGVMIKSPIDLIAGALRQFGVNMAAPTAATQLYDQYRLWLCMNDWAGDMGQSLGDVPNVSGWPAYYQTPAYYQSWLNTYTMKSRQKFLNLLITGWTGQNASLNGRKPSLAGIPDISIDVIAFVNQYPATVIADADQLIDAIVKTLLPLDIAVADKLTIRNNNLLQGQTNKSYWNTLWTSYLSSPTNTTILANVKSNLKSTLLAIMLLAEYQLM